MRKKLIRKGRQKGGFTLIELLVTVIVMLLVTEIISLTIRLGTRYYTQSVKNSESQTICDTLAAAVQEELQYATKIEPATGEGTVEDFTYYSRARQHGSNCRLVCGSDGRLYVRKGTNDFALVGSETYTYDLTANYVCQWDPTRKLFLVDLQVMDGDRVLDETHFNVSPLNGGY